MDPALTRDERATLLKLARATIEAHLEGRALPVLDEPAGALDEHRGAFVTLTVDNQLRGCIGHVEGIEPLWRSVRENAISAATRDPRFPPVGADELSDVEIEVSVLSVLELLADPHRITVGRHGLLIECGHRRGLLLPQVAESRGWDVATFLEHTCRKAGLGPECWRSREASVYAFTAEHFSESQVLDAGSDE
jgi:AmmeMemoRadiSam system protein A